jgi:hypothetical protein
MIYAAYKLPIISEAVEDTTGYEGLLYAEYHTLVAFIQEALRADPYWLQGVGERFYQRVCIDYTFRHMIESHV